MAPEENIALIFENKELTYGQLREKIRLLANGLNNQGLQAGDILGIWLPNTPRWLILHLACASLGIITLSLNLKLGIKELIDFIDRSQCKALAFDRSVVNNYAQANDDNLLDSLGLIQDNSLYKIWELHFGSIEFLIDATIGSERTVPSNLPQLCKHKRPKLSNWESIKKSPYQIIEGDARLDVRHCIILSSSGTTSIPKLIVHSQSNIALHAQDVASSLAVDGNSNTLIALPICGAFGYTVAMMTLAAGAKLVLHEVFDSVRAASVLEQQPITHMFGTNDMVEKIIAPLHSNWRPMALRIFGSANFVPGLDELPEQAERMGISMVGCFGMSELLALFAHQDPKMSLPRRSQSGGIPVARTSEVRVRLLDSGKIASPMESGELEFRAPYMLTEYLGNPEATAKAFTSDGFFCSGDLGYINGDGGFTHISRLGDILRIGGFLVNPAEIEEAVIAQCGAKACQVVAVNHSGGARPVAFVITDKNGTVDEDEIKASLKKQIARYKIPIRIFTIENFPCTISPNGIKVKRNELRDLAQSLLEEK